MAGTVKVKINDAELIWEDKEPWILELSTEYVTPDGETNRWRILTRVSGHKDGKGFKRR